MSDYTNTFGGATKDSTNATILGADYDTQYDNISTMSATKANKVTAPTTDNLLKMNANGDLADSGKTTAEVLVRVGSPVEDNLLAMDASGDTKDAGIALADVPAIASEQTDHVRSGTAQVIDGTFTGTAFDITSTVSYATNETVGPTGSSPDNTWTMLDNVPSNARILIVTLALEGVPTTPSDFSVHCYFWSGAESATTPTTLTSVYAKVNGQNGNSDTLGHSTQLLIPLDSNQRFSVRHISTNANSIVARLTYNGFITG